MWLACGADDEPHVHVLAFLRLTVDGCGIQIGFPGSQRTRPAEAVGALADRPAPGHHRPGWLHFRAPRIDMAGTENNDAASGNF